MRNINLKVGTIGASETAKWFNIRIMSVHCSAALRKGLIQPDTADENAVLIENVKNNGIITLNRPKVLNALNLSMYRKISLVLKDWEGSKKLVIIKAMGQKAFSAGGDVKAVSTVSDLPGGKKLGQDTFREGYTLIHMIGTYKTPYVAVLNGITMGGGVRISIHGPHRIATENTVFAMPETAIGLVPDAGATFFLPRLQGKLGYYLGLTGHRLKGTDVLLAGIATHYVPSERLEDLTNELLDSNNEDINGTIKKYQPDDLNPEFSLSPYLKQIDDCFSAPTMEEVMRRLESDGSDWAIKTVELLEKMSPTALSLTLQAIEKGSRLSLAECINMEFRLIFRSLTKDSDFYEGVRALLLDKDRKPVWKPKLLSEISREAIIARFANLPDGEELKLQ